MWTNLKRFQSKPSKQVPSQVSISKTSKFRHQPTIPFDLTCITRLGKKRIRCQAAAADTGIYRKTQKSKKRLHNSNKYHKTQSYSRSSSSSFDEHNQIVRFNRWCVYDWSVFGEGWEGLEKFWPFCRADSGTCTVGWGEFDLIDLKKKLVCLTLISVHQNLKKFWNLLSR